MSIISPTDTLYGPRGWTVKTGVFDAIKPYLDELTTFTEQPLRFSGSGDQSYRNWPFPDYMRFSGLRGTVCSLLYELLPASQLADRQNNSPTLGSLLQAAATRPTEVSLTGYVIGPQRFDERISIEALVWVDTAPPNKEWEETKLWEHIAMQHGLNDAMSLPDEIMCLGEFPRWASIDEKARAQPDQSGPDTVKKWWIWWD